MKNRAKAQRVVDTDPLLTIGDVQGATFTSRRFVEQQVKAGTLHAIRIGPRMLRIRRSELERWLASFEGSCGRPTVRPEECASSTAGGAA